MKPSLRDQLIEAGLKKPEEAPPKEIHFITGEIEAERSERVSDMSLAIYKPINSKRPVRTGHGKVKITEVKKRMEMKPINREATTYKILELLMQYPAVPVKLVMSKLPPGTNKSTVMSALVKYCQAGVMSVTAKEHGVKHYSIGESDKRLGADSLYIKHLEYQKVRSKGRNHRAGFKSKLPEVSKGQSYGVPSVIELRITGTVEHIFTFKIGR